MADSMSLLPSHLRFITCLVDAPALSLNVSRNTLQKDRRFQTIKKQLVKKVHATLEELKKEDKEKYLGFWAQFGPVVKEGLLPFDAQDKDKILDLLLAASTQHDSELTDLEGYKRRMKEGQEAI